jgi:hypothetical protein
MRGPRRYPAFARARFALLLSALVVAIASCVVRKAEEAPKKAMTQRERQRAIANAPLPGAGALGHALDLSDSMAARAAREDTLPTIP